MLFIAPGAGSPLGESPAPRKSTPALLNQLIAEKMPAVRILDFDDPKITVKTGFAIERRLRLILGNEFSAEAWDKAAAHIGAVETRWRWRKHRRVTIAAHDLDENGARIIVAVTQHSGECALHGAAAQISLDPDFRFETHQALFIAKLALSAMRTTAASRARTSALAGPVAMLGQL